ncbi:PREDICTED: aminoacylase-1-like [Papilio polytes]|uniref:aminoacylase-1-like n=1 Tax=Papilio polytes TaxID=76194 RepID=UPI0006764F04|nr:PREDICTED: aminoacylase-1-like [Papilio polytes]
MRHLRQILLGLCLVNVFVSSEPRKCEEYICLPEVLRFQEYIGINTVSGQDLSAAVDFWKRLGDAQNVEVTVFEGVRGFPVVIMKWPGENSSLPSVLLNAPMDVTDAYYGERWTYQPFSGKINDECEIVGRGTQGVKAAAMQYYEALSNLKRCDVTLLRDVYLVLTPDFITFSQNGLGVFVQTEEFQNMNVGIALTVGIGSEGPELPILHQDKTQIGLRVDCYGQSAFSALLIDVNKTAAGPCIAFYNAYVNYREEQYTKSLESNDYSEYTAINYVGHLGVNADNIPFRKIPASLTIFISVNLAHDTSLEQFHEIENGWKSDAVEIIRLFTYERSSITIANESNPYWVALKDTFDELDITVTSKTAPSVSDRRILSSAGIPTFGLLPIRNTPILVHAVNERLSIPVFLDGICIYEKVIERLANVPDDKVADDPKMYLTEPTLI